jgi:BirA family biotin operon repressor/biotin-[acetyl-CoA-carboxylase] ligase
MQMFVPRILRFDSLSSTNLEAARRAVNGAAEGLCVVSGEQTSGRGRLQRGWVSPKGAGLYFSIVLRPPFEQRVWPLLTLMAAIAVHDALLDSCALQTDIKWPNDLLADDKKVCGILAETVETGLGRAVVVGIGVNLTNSSFPAELAEIATSVEVAASQTPDLEHLLEALVQSLTKYYQALQQPGGPEEIVRNWCARSSYAQARRVRVIDAEEGFVGITRGLERDGALRVETDDGEIKTIRAADVSSVRPSDRGGSNKRGPY